MVTRYKLCMIGAHGHGSTVLRALKDTPEVTLAGVSTGCDMSPEKLLERCRASAGHLPEPPVFDDWRQMLHDLEPDILCVDGPFELHATMCAAAFARNIHVLVEKPAALTLPDLQMLATAHRSSRSQFTALMGMRYHPAFYTAWQYLQTGAIGAVRVVNTQKSYVLNRRQSFFNKRATYGGTIPWVGSHAFDWIRWYTGADFENVAAYHSTTGNRGHDELEATATCITQLRQGVLGCVTIDYLRPDTAGSHGDDRVRIIGVNGYIEVRDARVWVSDAAHGGVCELPLIPDRSASLFSDFVAQIEGRSVCRVPAADVFAVTEACLLARQSADEKRMLSCPNAGLGSWDRELSCQL